MKLPSKIGILANTIVCSELKKFKKKDHIGILFDWATFNRTQKDALMDHFSDCEEKDFQDIRKGEVLRSDCVPFVMWMPDELFDDRKVLLQKLKGNPKKNTVAYTRNYGEYPQFQSMWFLHKDGSVSTVDIDGTFLPRKTAKRLVDDYRELGIRLATPIDVHLDED